MRTLFSFLTAGLLAGAPVTSAKANPPAVVSAATYNLYVGTDLFQLLEPEPACGGNAQCSLVVQAGRALQEFFATDYNERAEKISRLIANRRPHVVGLQEVSDVTIVDAMTGGVQSIDFLQILVDKLAARGVEYEVAASVDNANIAGIPAGSLTPQGLVVENLVTLLDRDVILVRKNGIDFDPTSVEAAPYAPGTQLVVPIGGQNVEFTRSYVKVDVIRSGRRLAVANTHLEVEFEPGNPANGLQTAQASQLAATLATETDPLIVLGDFNSAPDSDNGLPGVPTPYQVLATAGFADTWTTQFFNNRPGYTCCQAELLDNPFSQLDKRIDQVWTGPSTDTGFIFANTFGDKFWQKTSSGLWPSDHAAVLSTMVIR